MSWNGRSYSSKSLALWSLLLTTALGHPACWRTGFPKDPCCAAGPPTPDASGCFDSIFTFDICCGASRTGASVEVLTILDELEACHAQGIFSGDSECDRWSAVWQALAFSTHSKQPIDAELIELAIQEVKGESLGCPVGVVGVIGLALPDLEKVHGTEFVADLWKRVVKMAARLETEVRKDCGWKLLSWQERFGVYELLVSRDDGLGLECPTELPVLSIPQLTSSPLGCYSQTKFWSSEILFERWVARRNRVKGPSAGSLERPIAALPRHLYIPGYRTCYLLRNKDISDPCENLEISPRQKRLTRSGWFASAMETVAKLTMDALTSNQPSDHRPNLVFFHGASSRDIDKFSGLAEISESAIHLTVEPSPIVLDSEWSEKCSIGYEMETIRSSVGGPSRSNSGHLSREIVIPPVVPADLRLRLLMHNQIKCAAKFPCRQYLASFHGSSQSSAGATGQNYRRFNETIRDRVFRVMSHYSSFSSAPLPVSFGPPTLDYAHIMGSSIFCIAPRGISSYTARVFEAIFAGCIPVVLSDDYEFPFPGLIEWRKMTVRWPEDKVDYLMGYLDEIVRGGIESEGFGRIEKAQEILKRDRCWLDWIGEWRSEVCSPYLAILRALDDAEHHELDIDQSEPLDDTKPPSRFWALGEDLFKFIS